MSRLDAATLAQVRAARPEQSTWLSANAGSGKTRVLTDRVALLLLRGVSPQNILCLTYTKAAASEMQNRLYERLGSWAMLPDKELSDKLAVLSEHTSFGLDDLVKARRLFAMAIETPGGLKIQTIHSFCASLLRRFPLEAQVSPSFTEMDDRAVTDILRRCLDDMAVEDPEPFDAFIDGIGGKDLLTLAATITGQRDKFTDLPAEPKIRRIFEAPESGTLEEFHAAAFTGDEAELFQHLIPLLRPLLKTMATRAAQMEALLPDPGLLRLWPQVVKLTLTASGPNAGKPASGMLTKAARDLAGDHADALVEFAERVAEAHPQILALQATKKTLALHRFVQALLPRYEAAKQSLNCLDFNDLLTKARDLLRAPGVADWVLYRLDGGVGHILVDEAQDTSPIQWEIIDLLTQELTSGQGSSNSDNRTLFVVGDKKQSIYSFQGADPDRFDQMKQDFGTRLSRVHIPLQDLQLQHSFRSAPAILGAVDATFQEGNKGLGENVSHIAFHDHMPGRVDVWPPLPKTEKEEPGNWEDPVDKIAETHHAVQLARAIAAEIKRMMAEENIWDPKNDWAPRVITPKDILILVQSRSPLFHELIRACKANEIPIAGADRLKVGAELAVKDIAAVLHFLAMPDDSLSLAAALRSPLFGWSEDDLYRLAQPRKQDHLWPALRDSEHTKTVSILQDLRGQVDFLRPYDLISRLLVQHRGRHNLVARLGPEAEEGIDALCAQALAYEQSETPSLTGFLAWFDPEAEIKRQPDAAENKLRIMTVHGAKGLEAPIVIVPDGGKRKEDVRDDILTTADFPLWKLSKDDRPEALSAYVEAAKEKLIEERQRLLYVAMTRAEQWLILCAAGDTGDEGQSWLNIVNAGVSGAGGTPHDFKLGWEPSEGVRFENWPDRAVDHSQRSDPKTKETTELPEWAKTPAEPAKPPEQSLSPSNLGGAKALHGETSEDFDTNEAMAQGDAIHQLLDRLPNAPQAQWPDLAQSLLGDRATPAILSEATQVLTAPHLAHLYQPGTLSEVPVTADLPGLGRIYGIIDRLVIGADTVFAVDYKSNAIIPANAEDVPLGLLRQMGAYAQALTQIYPDHRIETALLWTKTAQLMTLPHALVNAALQTTTMP